MGREETNWGNFLKYLFSPLSILFEGNNNLRVAWGAVWLPTLKPPKWQYCISRQPYLGWSSLRQPGTSWQLNHAQSLSWTGEEMSSKQSFSAKKKHIRTTCRGGTFSLLSFSFISEGSSSFVFKSSCVPGFCLFVFCKPKSFVCLHFIFTYLGLICSKKKSGPG